MPSKGSTGQLLITSPASGNSSTLTPGSIGSGGVSFNERFKPAQNGATAESLYSLATESGVEVKRQLAGGTGGDLPAGIPLSEALASKGLGNGASRAATMDPGCAYPMSGLSDCNFFSPRPPGVNDPQGIYSLAQQETHTKATRSATLMPGAQLDQRDVQQYGGVGGHRPLQATSSLGGGRGSLDPATGVSRGQPGQSSPNSAGPTVSSVASVSSRTGTGTEMNRAELLENGYMAPRRIPRPSGYEYPPFGPPRPVGGDHQPLTGSISSGSIGSGTPTSRQPHSALLLRPEGEKVSSPLSSLATGGGERGAASGGARTYINVQSLDGSAPPPIDRTTKPTPPVIDRTLKPVGYQSPKNTPPEYDGGVLDQEEEDEDSDSSDSSPEMSKKHASSSGVPFSIADLPKPTNRTTQYTQVEIVNATNRVKISSSPAADDDNAASRKVPIPVPRERDRDHPIPKPRRVNYSDIDLTATAARVEARTTTRSPTLRKAEQEHLKDKPYINVNREGDVDDDTDPGYYTHMRVSAGPSFLMRCCGSRRVWFGRS